jgi:hypothetical protein
LHKKAVTNSKSYKQIGKTIKKEMDNTQNDTVFEDALDLNDEVAVKTAKDATKKKRSSKKRRSPAPGTNVRVCIQDLLERLSTCASKEEWTTPMKDVIKTYHFNVNNPTSVPVELVQALARNELNKPKRVGKPRKVAANTEVEANSE